MTPGSTKVAKIAATVLALVLAILAVFTAMGWALVQAVDMGSNAASIGGYLHRLHEIGTVNLGDVLLALFGLLGVTAIVMAIWKLGPFKVTTSITQAPSHLDHAAEPEVPPFGLLYSISFQCINERTTHPRFRCICMVMFYGGTTVEASPTQLSVRTPNSGPELARLDAAVGQKCAGTVSYTGEGDWRALMDAVDRTMSGTTQGMPWQVFPPNQELYCDIDLSVPDGPVGAAHAGSGVKMEFELSNCRNTIRTVKLFPWSTRDQSPRVSPTLL